MLRREKRSKGRETGKNGQSGRAHDIIFYLSLAGNFFLGGIILIAAPTLIEHTMAMQNCWLDVIEFYNTQKYCPLLCDSNNTWFDEAVDARYLIVMINNSDTNLSVILPNDNYSKLLLCQRDYFRNLSDYMECSEYKRLGV